MVALEFYQYLSFPYLALIPPVPSVIFFATPTTQSRQKRSVGSPPLPVRYFLEQPLATYRAKIWSCREEGGYFACVIRGVGQTFYIIDCFRFLKVQYGTLCENEEIHFKVNSQGASKRGVSAQNEPL